MGRTTIEWTATYHPDGTVTPGATWNPVTGCPHPVSPGCDKCYAATLTNRFKKKWGDFTTVRCHYDRLEQPLRWKEPMRIFADSMSDLWCAPVPFIRRVYDVMARGHWHTYPILTKRAARMARVTRVMPRLPNVWLGVSVESREYLGRLSWLRQSPAAIHFVSFEPLLAPIGEVDLSDIEWAIAGGESGPGHRPLDLDWVREIRDQCTDQEVPFFFKQVGGLTPKSGGRLLDGRTWDEFPEPRENHFVDRGPL